MGTGRNRQQCYRVSLDHRRSLTSGTFELHLARPAGFEFRPGQKITLFGDTAARDYTLVGAPEDRTLSICVRHVSGGRLSPALARAEAGDRFQISAPFGFFLYQSAGRRAVFAATGTGIAPFVAFVRSGVRGFCLLHGVRTQRQLYYRDILSQSAEQYSPCISGSRTHDGRPPDAYSGRVTGFLENCLSRGTYDFYLCGRREMVRDATRIIDRRFPDSRVFTEAFF